VPGIYERRSARGRITLGRDCNHARRSIQDLRGRGWLNAAFDFRADVVRRASVDVRGTLTRDSAWVLGRH
jgi:hypothetical protein